MAGLTTTAVEHVESACMSDEWISAKPESKRGVNKANMDAPQPEFIDDNPGSDTSDHDPQERKSEPPRKAEP